MTITLVVWLLCCWWCCLVSPALAVAFRTCSDGSLMQFTNVQLDYIDDAYILTATGTNSTPISSVTATSKQSLFGLVLTTDPPFTPTCLNCTNSTFTITRAISVPHPVPVADLELALNFEQNGTSVGCVAVMTNLPSDPVFDAYVAWVPLCVCLLCGISLLMYHFSSASLSSLFYQTVDYADPIRHALGFVDAWHLVQYAALMTAANVGIPSFIRRMGAMLWYTVPVWTWLSAVVSGLRSLSTDEVQVIAKVQKDDGIGLQQTAGILGLRQQDLVVYLILGLVLAVVVLCVVAIAGVVLYRRYKHSLKTNVRMVACVALGVWNRVLHLFSLGIVTILMFHFTIVDSAGTFVLCALMLVVLAASVLLSFYLVLTDSADVWILAATAPYTLPYTYDRRFWGFVTLMKNVFQGILLGSAAFAPSFQVVGVFVIEATYLVAVIARRPFVVNLHIRMFLLVMRTLISIAWVVIAQAQTHLIQSAAAYLALLVVLMTLVWMMCTALWRVFKSIKLLLGRKQQAKRERSSTNILTISPITPNFGGQPLVESPSSSSHYEDWSYNDTHHFDDDRESHVVVMEDWTQWTEHRQPRRPPNPIPPSTLPSGVPSNKSSRSQSHKTSNESDLEDSSACSLM